MRVGYLTYGLDRAPTGIGRYAVELLRALQKQSGDVEMVLLTTEREDKHALWGEFEHYALPGCRLLPGLLTLGNAALSYAAWRYKLDIIHDPNGIAPFISPAFNTQRIVTIHDAFAYVYPQTHNRLDNLRFRYILPRAVRHADMILTDSENSKRDIQRFLAVSDSKIRVLTCGVDSQFAPFVNGAVRQVILERYNVKPPYLLYLGGINARKNIARLFEAYAVLRLRHPALNLVIVGKRQWQTAEIDATFRRLQLEDAVHFTGYVPDIDLPALYSAATAFVFPSLYEGFGLPPLEAMACGTPVVTSSASSLPEVVGDAAIMVDPYNVPALTEALEQVLTDEQLRAQLIERGLARAAKFSWQRIARETLTVYKSMLLAGQFTAPLPEI